MNFGTKGIMSPKKNKHISHYVLIGMMGSGKTHIGKMLAQALDRNFVDSDHYIEKNSGYTIPEIFEKFGEPEFRRLEVCSIKNLIAEDKPQVIALGGGAVMNDEAAELVFDQSISIWVDAPMDHIIERVRSCDNRPLLEGKNLANRLQELMLARKERYARADIVVKNENDKAQDAIQEILDSSS